MLQCGLENTQPSHMVHSYFEAKFHHQLRSGSVVLKYTNYPISRISQYTDAGIGICIGSSENRKAGQKFKKTTSRPPRSNISLSNIRKMATHNIVVFAGDHCGPEVSSMLINGFIEIY
jgi:hypothetical protein